MSGLMSLIALWAWLDARKGRRSKYCIRRERVEFGYRWMVYRPYTMDWGAMCPTWESAVECVRRELASR